MKSNGNYFHNRMTKQRRAGFALLDVVLAMAVFAFGMLALVQLQGSMARASADANVRTVAASVAEEMVERLRAYRSVIADPDNNLVEFMEMEGTVLSDTVDIKVGGDGDTLLIFDRLVTVTNFWWDGENDTFIRTTDMTQPEGVGRAYPNFKLLKLDVSWSNSDDFYVSDTTTADLESGSITIYEIISSTPASVGAQLASPLEDDTGPPVVYNPGDAPEIVKLTLDGPNTKFKESTRPAPIVVNNDAVRETWFDVVTYNDGGDDAIFLRREEFVIVNCECSLEQADDPGEGGFRPTLWNGYDYTEGEWVAKPFGVSADNNQSAFCDTCCRDHHDSGDGELDTVEIERIVYDPWNAPNSAPSDDHLHYGFKKGQLIEVGTQGVSVYAEACRLVRKDGFMRVTHDFNQQALFGFPGDYLDNASEITEYSGYVVEAVTDFVNNDLSSFKQPGDAGLSSGFLVPASSYDSDVGNITAPTNLPTPLGNESQQLRSRGIYVDYLTDELRTNLGDCPGTSCVFPGYTVPQEMYPFVEVQLTGLSTWIESPANDPVSVEEERFLTTTGLATLENSKVGQAEIKIQLHKGNIGFVGMDPKEPEDFDTEGSSYRDHLLYIDTLDGIPSPVQGVLVSGNIAKDQGVPANVKASNTMITFEEAECNRTTQGFACIVPSVGVATIRIYDDKSNKALYYCDQTGALTKNSQSAVAYDNWAIFTLPTDQDYDDADIVIQTAFCN